MSEAIIVAAFSLVGVIFTAVWQNKKLGADFEKQSELADARLEKAQAVTDAKIDELTREVREHNNFARRVPIIEEQIKVANHRIEDLERVTAK